MAVLIISNSLDAHSDEVEKGLQRIGVGTIRLNTDRFVSDSVFLTYDHRGGGSISVNNNTYNFEQITSALLRRPETPEVAVSHPQQKKFAELEAEEFIRQLYRYLPGKFWINEISALEIARRKLPQLRVAQKCGFKVPETIATNSPDAVRVFFASHQSRVIYKTLRSPTIRLNSENEVWGVPTTILTDEHLPSLNLIRNTGGIFQEYIDKLYEVRVTVIGKNVFAAKIDSQAEPSARIDWREAVARGLVKVTAYTLPEAEKAKCLEIIAWYGLQFGAIDLVYSLNSEYVFLELNCNGQWLWVEDLTGQHMLDTMVELLAKGGDV